MYHRGLERRTIFRDDRDRCRFLELLSEIHDRYRIRIFAYCLMSNHWHGVVQTPDANLSGAMQWLHLSYASWFNARYRRVGPVFAGRFGSTPIENGDWAYSVSLYVHLNPVCRGAFDLGKRAQKIEGRGLRTPSREVATKRVIALREYRWSSYRFYGGYEAPPEWLDVRKLLSRAARLKSERSAAYRAAAQGLLTKGVEPRRHERLRERLAIGSTAFVQEIKQLAKGGDRETENRRALRRRCSFEDVVKAIEKQRGEHWVDMSHRRGDPARPLAMWAARRLCGMTLRETGDRLDGMDYAAVSVALKRLERKSEQDRSLRRVMANLTKVLNVEM